MAQRRFRWNNGFTTEGPVFTTSRAGTIPIPNGVKRQPGQPRYAALNQSIASAPVVRTADASNDLFVPMASGKWSDGREAMLLFQGSSLKLSIHLDSYSVANATSAGRLKSIGGIGSGVPPYKSGKADLAKGTPDEAELWYYAPVSGVVCHGAVLCQTTAFFNTTGSGNWEARRTAMFKWDETNLRWSKIHEGPSLQNGQNRGAAWASSGNWWSLDDSPSPPLEAWISWVDYRFNPSSTGGACWLMRLYRSTAEDSWTFDTPVLIANEESATSGTHWHVSAVRRFGAAGMCVVLVRGDGKQLNRVIGLFRSDTTYKEGLDATNGVTVPLADITLDAVQNSWTCKNLLGRKDGTVANSDGCLQFIGCAPKGDDGLLCGADNNLAPIQKLTIPATATKSNVTNTNFISTCTSDQGFCAFHIQARQDLANRGPYICKVGPSDVSTVEDSGTYEDDDAIGKVAVSENGDDWAFAWACYTYATDTAVLFNGEVFVGNKNKNSLGLRAFRWPRIITSLTAEVGGTYNSFTNRLQSTIVAPVSGVGTGNTIADVTSTYQATYGAPAAPGAGNVFRCAASATASSNGFGTWLLSAAAAMATTQVRYRIGFWVYIIPALDGTDAYGSGKGSGSNARLDFTLIAGDASNVFAANKGTSKTQLGISNCGRWELVTLEFDGTTSPALSFGAAYQLGAFLYLNTSGNCTADILIQWAFAQSAGSTNWPNPPARPIENGSTQYDEISALSSLSLGDDWTIVLAAQVPAHYWDSRTKFITSSAWSSKPITLLTYDGKFIQVLLTPDRTAANCKVSLYEGIGASTTDLAVPPNHAQSMLRYDAVLVGLSYVKSTGTITLVASVGGIPIASGSAQLNGGSAYTFTPVAVVFGDQNGLNGQPLSLHAGYVNTDTAESSETIQGALETLSFIGTLNTAYPPLRNRNN